MADTTKPGQDGTGGGNKPSGGAGNKPAGGATQGPTRPKTGK